MLIFFRLAMSCLNSPKISSELNSMDSIQGYLIWAVVRFIYYGLSEFFSSRTLAKYFTKTIVVMEDGSKPTIMAILARTILRIVPFEALTFLRGRALDLHDENSNTFVVMKSKFENQLKEHLDLISLENS